MTNNKLNENAIREAAYYIWQKAGCPSGQEAYHWSLAIDQLSKKCSGSCSQKSSSSASKKSSASTVSAAKKSSASSSAAKKVSKK